MKKKRYVPRLVHIPVTGALRDEFAMTLHTALWCLDHRPSVGAFDRLAGIFNVVQITLEHDARHQHEARLINGGAQALNQIVPKVEAGRALADYETAPIRVGVNTIDSLLGKLSVTTIYAAMQRLNALRAATSPT